VRGATKELLMTLQPSGWFYLNAALVQPALT
jgi:hypothetical protein